MTALLLGLSATMASSGLTMEVLERAYASPRYADHHFRDRLPLKATENEKKWLFWLNSLISLGMVYGVAVLAYPYLFVDAEAGALSVGLQAGAVLLVYDGLYYAMHRGFHHKKVMRFMHGLHHQARTPTARDSLYTHPFEMMAGLGLLLASTWLVGPVHVPAFLLAFFVFSFLNVIIHSGIAFPSGPLRVLNYWARKHHGHHGVDMNTNYGSLTPLWDLLFGTALKESR